MDCKCLGNANLQQFFTLKLFLPNCFYVPGFQIYVHIAVNMSSEQYTPCKLTEYLHNLGDTYKNAICLVALRVVVLMNLWGWEAG